MTRTLSTQLADFTLFCATSFALGFVVGVAFFRSLPL